MTKRDTPDSAGKKVGKGSPPKNTQFKAGAAWSGNSKGRPKGSRNQLAESFIADLQLKWEEKGVEAIDRMVTDDPGGFVRVVASILPKELHIKDDMSDISDGELAAFLDAARAALGIREEGGEDAPNADRSQQAKTLRSLQ